MSNQIGNKSGIFSERLKSLRGARSKADFARFLGIPNTPTYHRYEGGRIPNMETLGNIAARCNVSVAWLLGEDNTPVFASDRTIPIASGDVERDRQELSGHRTVDEAVKTISEQLDVDEGTVRGLVAELIKNKGME